MKPQITTAKQINHPIILPGNGYGRSTGTMETKAATAILFLLPNGQPVIDPRMVSRSR
jgi:hypothetical protein